MTEAEDYEELKNRTEQLKNRTENIIRLKGYTIDNHEESSDPFNFEIKTVTKLETDIKVVSYIEIYETTGLIREGPAIIRRGPISDKPQIPKAVTIELPVFSISHLFTYAPYRKQGLGILLLVYSICKLKLQFLNIEYVRLEDSVDTNDKFIGNFYTPIGFRYVDAYKYDRINDLVKPIDNAKQLHINQQFLKKSNQILNGIINKMSGALPPPGKDRITRSKSAQNRINMLSTKGGKKSNRKTKKYKRKTKRRRC